MLVDGDLYDLHVVYESFDLLYPGKIFNYVNPSFSKKRFNCVLEVFKSL